MRVPGGGASELAVAFAPGRVNLIGDHTDYTGGLAMPVALSGLGTEVSFQPDGAISHITLCSSVEEKVSLLPLHATTKHLAALRPASARYAACVAAEFATGGGRAAVRTNLPLRAGLSSSASFEVALALALGAPASLETALACMRAEQRATGVETGPLDQLTVTLARAGHGLLLDCGTLTFEHVPLPRDLDILVCHSGHSRSVRHSDYARRRQECADVESLIGPLRQAGNDDVSSLRDPLLRRRARHVVSENQRVRAFAEALAADEPEEAGRLMSESHVSLAKHFEVSVPALDELVAFLQSSPRVLGARMFGAGFGGCAVALCRPGSDGRRFGRWRHWVVVPADGALLPNRRSLDA